MRYHRFYWVIGVALLSLGAGLHADGQEGTKAVTLSLGQKDFLALEPILVNVQSSAKGVILPATPGKGVRFEVKPLAQPRGNAKPLPLEGKATHPGITSRTYDLLEWFQFKDGETYTVRAVAESQGSVQTSQPITFTIRRPDKADAEWGPVDRLHHLPWSNYVVDAFCGDTFDTVKRWPDSKLSKYCHYYNGLHQQHKKEYDKAIDSFQTVLAKYPEFILADHAAYGIAECLLALGKNAEAKKQLEGLTKKASTKGPMSAVQSLALTTALEISQGKIGASTPARPK